MNTKRVEEAAEELAQELGIDATQSAPKPGSGRPRSATVLKLQWLAERLRKCERIKKEVNEGSYQVESQEVAKALLNKQDD